MPALKPRYVPGIPGPKGAGDTNDWCIIYNIGNSNQIYTSFCSFSNAERIISSIKCIFDEILSKFWLF